jgi:cytochrome c peroxidase
MDMKKTQTNGGLGILLMLPFIAIGIYEIVSTITVDAKESIGSKNRTSISDTETHSETDITRMQTAQANVVTGVATAVTSAPTTSGTSTGFDIPAMVDGLKKFPGQIGALPEVPIPSANPSTPEKIELGKMLYFDNRLSGDKLTSCATCHDPAKGYADGLSLAEGFKGKILGRHSPTVLNAAYNTAQFWDGRVDTLEQQAVGPIMAAGEMNMGSEEALIAELTAVEEYNERFNDVFGESPTLQLVGDAIAAFERTIVNSDSPFDQYARGDKSALTEQEKRGLFLFFGKASCTQCHSGPNFSDNKYYNLGMHDADEGRYAVSKLDADRGAFKTATIRNATLTAPFMHDGSLETLEEVVEFYNKGGADGSNKSELIFPLYLEEDEEEDLVAFLKAVTGSLPEFEMPVIPEYDGANAETENSSFETAANSSSIPSVPDNYRSLSHLMEKGIHEQYTFLSFNIWHRSPLDEGEMKGIAEAAGKMEDLAAKLPKYKRNSWSDTMQGTFDTKSLRLKKLIENLQTAALDNDEPTVTSLFALVENSCHSCHAVFNEELADPLTL